MPFLIVENGNILKEFNSLSQEFPNISFTSSSPPADELPEGVVYAYTLPQPAVSPLQTASLGPYSYNPTSERWEREWLVSLKPEPELSVALEAEKQAKINAINQWRLDANSSTFPHDGKVFQCDRLSRGDIDWVNGSVAIHGVLPPSVVALGGWKALDNTVYPIPDVAAWNAFYASIGVQGAANFMRSSQLKAQVAAITDPATAWESLNAIVW